eukprot:COSAG05_NODE_11033_length_534_cov_0.781609_2_plen_22_part_01
MEAALATEQAAFTEAQIKQREV